MSKGTQTLAYKQGILNGKLAAIEVAMAIPRNPEVQRQIQALQDGLTFRLKELVEKSRHEEIDLKLAVFTEVQDVLKQV